MITKNQALQKLASSPADAAAFDEATKINNPGMSREESVELTLQILNAKRDQTAKLAQLKQERTELKAQLSKLKSQSNQNKTMPTVQPVNKPSAPVSPKLVTAAAFASPIITMSRAEFSKLSPSDKSRFLKGGHKLSN